MSSLQGMEGMVRGNGGGNGSMKGDVKRKHYCTYWKLFKFSASSPF
jgi:hypothetical protein